MINHKYYLHKENVTELKESDVNDSTFHTVIAFKTKEVCNKKTSELFSLKGEIPEVEKKLFINNKQIVEEQLLHKKMELEELVGKLTKKLVHELQYFSVDDTELSYAERVVLDIEKEYSLSVLGEVLQNIYIQYNNYPNMLAGICKAIGRFERNEVMPWGSTMLTGLLSHKNDTVKEYAVAVVENWADVELLPVLKNVDCSSQWLKEYIEDVINYLEECYVLHKKVI